MISMMRSPATRLLHHCLADTNRVILHVKIVLKPMTFQLLLHQCRQHEHQHRDVQQSGPSWFSSRDLSDSLTL